MKRTIPELKPCPFCKGTAPRIICEDDPWLVHPIPPHYVVCECGARGPVAFDNADAAAAWNKRVDNGKVGSA